MEKTNTFARFDVVSDDSDHHFRNPNWCRNKGDRVCFTNTKSEVYKIIMREWKILEENLPESIYVRVYERRIDLLRAAIVGVAGTPYHDGLFFFDIAFPSDYPKSPPRIHYRSFGLRLNPNLYANGVVCLSLLNTWMGQKSERWDPSGSTLLQVLLSIQSLVLNDEPFFNEPSYASFGNSHHHLNRSRAYSEHAFSLTCQTSVYLLRNPPKNFKEFVRAHFSERAPAILAACNEYVNGRVRVGNYGYNDDDDDDNESRASSVKVSEEFKGLMKGLYPKMVEAFQRTGAHLGTSLEHLELERKRSEKNNNGIFKKAIAKIKRALGWKNKIKSQS
ncbi:probable ubiquitin-conjugating enzyme E2 25 [Gastrolobium bilobum]|uniref:probable ubiquitin-conjugating enzyme E2 25 n=1 Tax=Gastrolobium bilobum TaxID=150636 RepID=UPI002AB0BFFB|nr:probable ubiquitin-conjugating enzyme E2 25 [Gastrolobium bilobum]